MVGKGVVESLRAEEGVGVRQIANPGIIALSINCQDVDCCLGQGGIKERPFTFLDKTKGLVVLLVVVGCAAGQPVIGIGQGYDLSGPGNLLVLQPQWEAGAVIMLMMGRYYRGQMRESPNLGDEFVCNKGMLPVYGRNLGADVKI